MTRHAGIDLLHPHSTRVMQALSLVSAEHRDLIPWDDLPKVFDPYQAPARLLPWLATVFSLDVWFDRWSEDRKRETIARSIELHRLKGTLAGLEEYVELADARVHSVVTPPSLFFLSDFDEEAYQAWLQRLPEVRIYHWTVSVNEAIAGALTEPDGVTYAEEEIVPGEVIEHFLSFEDAQDDETIPGGFSLQDEGYPIRAGVRATLIEDGVETELDIENANDPDALKQGVVADAERVIFPETAGMGIYLSALDEETEDVTFLDDGYMHDGSDRRYAFFVRRTGESAIAVNSFGVRGRSAVDSDPIRVYFDEAAPFSFFLDDPETEAYLSSDNEIVYSYYDSWRVVDPRVKAQETPAFNFLDYDRFSIAPYNAEALIDLTEPQVLDQQFLDYGVGGYMIEQDLSALYDVCDVVVLASAARDVVLLDLDYAERPSLRRIYSFEDMIL